MKKQLRKNVAGFMNEIMIAIILYFVASIIMEGIVIGAFSSAGYDVLHGDMPNSIITAAAPLYGFIGYTIIVIVFWTKIKKYKLSDMKLNFNGINIILYIILFLIGSMFVFLLIEVFGICRIYSFNGFSNDSILDILVLIVGYMIQGFGEEVFCRGYVQNAIGRKYNRYVAIFGSCVIFILPHLTSVMEFDTSIAFVSILNLILVSVLFSYIMIKCNSVLAAAGFHAGWNIMLNVILGLTVSGLNTSTCLYEVKVLKNSFFTGADYGIEASIVLTIILFIVDLIFLTRDKKVYGGK